MTHSPAAPPPSSTIEILFECNPTWAILPPSVDETPPQMGWSQGHMMVVKRTNINKEEEEVNVSWWVKSPPLTNCVPKISETVHCFIKSRPGMYPPLPEGTEMVTFGNTTNPYLTFATVLVLPVDEVIKLKAAVVFDKKITKSSPLAEY